MRFIVAFIAILLFLLLGCDNNDPSSGLTVVVNLMGYDTTVDESITADFDDLITSTVNNQEVITLDQFVTTTLIPKYDNKTPDDPSDDVDRRPLFAYRLVGSDGFNAHDNRDADDQPWSHMVGGYLVKETRDAGFDASLNLPGMYRVKDVATIEIYRKADVIMPDTSFLMEPSDLTITAASGEDAVALTTLLGKVTSPENYSYNIESIDGYNKDLTWAQIQTGHLLLVSDKLFFDPDLGGQYKISNVLKITGSVK